MPHKTRILLLLKFFNSFSWRSSTWELCSCEEEWKTSTVKLSVNWNNIRELYCSFHATFQQSRKVEKKYFIFIYFIFKGIKGEEIQGAVFPILEFFFLSSLGCVDTRHSLLSKHEIFIWKISPVISRELTALSAHPLAWLCSWPWRQQNHQSLSTNGGFLLVHWSLPNYSRATLPTNTEAWSGLEKQFKRNETQNCLYSFHMSLAGRHICRFSLSRFCCSRYRPELAGSCHSPAPPF